MKLFLLAVTVISSLLMVGVILLQQGKGAGLGSSFGGGARGGLYETASKANFLTRTTAILATIFLASSLALSLHIGREGSVLDELEETPVVETVPADSADTAADISEETPVDDAEEAGAGAEADAADAIPEDPESEETGTSEQEIPE